MLFPGCFSTQQTWMHVFNQERNDGKFSQPGNSAIFLPIIFELVAVFQSSIVSYIDIGLVSSQHLSGKYSQFSSVFGCTFRQLSKSQEKNSSQFPCIPIFDNFLVIKKHHRNKSYLTSTF